MICQLVNLGKKVGITAVSHKGKLLDEVLDAARELNGVEVSCAHRRDGDAHDGRPVREIDTNEEALQSLQSGAVNVLGGTPWLWSREDFRDSVHLLFVDEAGQMSLANVLACAPAGRSLVLLGDPQQLEQPRAAIRRVRTFQRWLIYYLMGAARSVKDKASFLPKPGVFTLRSASSPQSCFTKDDSSHLTATLRSVPKSRLLEATHCFLTRSFKALCDTPLGFFSRDLYLGDGTMPFPWASARPSAAADLCGDTPATPQC
jgi:hypothetical protein